MEIYDEYKSIMLGLFKSVGDSFSYMKQDDLASFLSISLLVSEEDLLAKSRTITPDISFDYYLNRDICLFFQKYALLQQALDFLSDSFHITTPGWYRERVKGKQGDDGSEGEEISAILYLDTIVHLYVSLNQSARSIIAGYLKKDEGPHDAEKYFKCPFEYEDDLSGINEFAGFAERLRKDVFFIIATMEATGDRAQPQAEKESLLLLRVLLHFIHGSSFSQYFIVMLILCSSSNEASEKMKSIAKSMVDFFIPLLRVGCIESLRINPVVDYDARGRQDNSSIIQLVLTTKNLDPYVIRIDTPHEGAEYMHVNMEGGGDINFITLEEYKRVLNELESMNSEIAWEQYFNNYDDVLVSFREVMFHKSDLAIQLVECFDKTHDHRLTHQRIFSSDVSVNELNRFVEVISLALPVENKKKIDKTGVFVEKCLQHHKSIKLIIWAIFCKYHFSTKEYRKDIKRVMQGFLDEVPCSADVRAFFDDMRDVEEAFACAENELLQALAEI